MKRLYLLTALFGALIFSGCETSDSNINSVDAEPIIEMFEYRPNSEPTGTDLTKEIKDDILNECGNVGGVAIYTGFDEDKNGVLGQEEYSKNSPKLICNGKNSLIDVKEANSFNSKCKNYGVVITSYIDVNTNGILDEDIDLTQKSEELCEGEDGSSGTTITEGKALIDGYGNTIGQELIFKTGDKEEFRVEVKNGVTPTITTSTISGDKVDEPCYEVGGQTITVEADEKTEEIVVCNGKNADDLVSKLSLDFNSTTNEMKLLNDTTELSKITLQKEQSIQLSVISEGNETCYYGGTLFQKWLDVDGDGNIDGNEELSEPTVICNAVEKTPSKPTITAINITDPQNISFSFSEAMNPATVNESTVFIDCNNSYVYSRINFHYMASTITDFNLTTDNNSTQLDYNTSGCQFVITDYVEDINGTRLADKNVTNLQ